MVDRVDLYFLNVLNSLILLIVYSYSTILNYLYILKMHFLFVKVHISFHEAPSVEYVKSHSQW